MGIRHPQFPSNTPVGRRNCKNNRPDMLYGMASPRTPPCAAPVDSGAGVVAPFEVPIADVVRHVQPPTSGCLGRLQVMERELRLRRHPTKHVHALRSVLGVAGDRARHVTAVPAVVRPVAVRSIVQYHLAMLRPHGVRRIEEKTACESIPKTGTDMHV